MRLTILAEDTVYRHGLLGEHGLSVLVERDGASWLFDTGQTGMVTRNAVEMGIDLRGISGIILSHGHYDHAGGLPHVLDATGPKDVFCHPGIFVKRYYLEDDGRRRKIGVPWKRGDAEKKGARFHLNKGPVKPERGMMLSGTIPSPSCYRRGIDTKLEIVNGDRHVVDRVEDEQCLILESDRGLVVVLGCAHRGLIQMLEHAKRLTGYRRIYAVAGGTHLMRLGKESVRAAIADLGRLGVERIAVCHCTGPDAVAALKKEFPGRVLPCSTGETLDL